MLSDSTHNKSLALKYLIKCSNGRIYKVQNLVSVQVAFAMVNIQSCWKIIQKQLSIIIFA